MAKNYSNRNKKRKALIAMLCALSVTCTGLAAACADDNEEDKPSTAVTAKDDIQLLKNGNFEHFDVPDKAVHLIKNVNSWTLGGGSSVKSGIIGTSKDDWDKLTDEDLSSKLDYNNDLASDSDDYVNYNSMRSRDILYKDTYAAMLADDKVSDSWIEKIDGGYEEYFGITGTGTDGDPYMCNGKEVYKKTLTDSNKKEYVEFYYREDDTLVRKTLIENPGTHYTPNLNGDETKITVGGKEYDVLTDKDSGNRYYKDDDGNENYFGNVLMIHNGSTDADNKGIQQYYTSNTISLEAHTSAEISLWVKTSDIKFNKGYTATAIEEDKGAFIEVVQTVAGTTIDSFQIKSINTQNIIASAETTLSEDTVSNGWIKYTVYVNACDFANTTIQLKLGLGGSEENEKITGYAFFDDVQVTRYRDLGAEGCTYDENNVTDTTCTLTSEEGEKIFYADVAEKRDADKELQRHPYNFHYLIDLASIIDNNNKYQPINFNGDVTVGLTTEKNSKDVEYAAAPEIASGVIKVVTNKGQSGLKIPKDVQPRPTKDDLITVLNSGDTLTSSDTKYYEFLNNVAGEKQAPKLLGEDSPNGNTLLMFSAWGAPYTATITNSKFSLEKKDDYLLVSFWVKTSDMDGNTAATIKIYELKDGVIDDTSVKTLTVDTTDQTTDFEDEKDIYKGWVQCFFFVKNDTDEGKTFNIDFSFGSTSIISNTSYESGYAAIANLQTLDINEDIYNLASSGTNTALFSFAKESEKDSGKTFDDATGVYDVSEGIALPSSYTGTNGENVVTVNGKDASLAAGLINRDSFDEYSAADKSLILSSFMGSTKTWNDVFGKNCYQPLIITNSLREYAVKAKADENTYKNYYVYDEDTGFYTKVASDAKWNENETYYSLEKVANYGFIGKDKTISGSEVISVRVKVTGNAKAYIYLINTDDTDEILEFTTPSYTFWYDEEGNVLDGEVDEKWTAADYREHIVYKLREDGLYVGKDGKIYGNLYNLVKSYKDSKYEHDTFYNADGNKVSYDDLKDGETYYRDEELTKKANHYLCATDGTHVYEYIDGKYYYVEITKNNGKTTETTNKNLEVNYFDTDKAPLRYTDNIDKQLYVEVTAEDCDPANGLCDEYGWVTVNFVIKAGNETKNYRLELWNGERDKTGATEETVGAVAFDYSHKSVGDKVLETYETEIINAYNTAIGEVDPALLKDESLKDANISDYEKFLDSDKVTAEQKTAIEAAMASYKYKASYYTYTLYDSAAYVPFNATTAGDGETDYDYDASEYEETLAYFEFEDTSTHEKNIFVDYSAVDQTIDRTTTSGGDDNEEEETTNSTELGLYISSIVLVVVLLITLISILVTQYVRKIRKQRGVKNSNKNVYRKRDRYVKKLHLVKDEMVEPEDGEGETNNVTAEEVTPVEDEVTEIPAEETTETVEPTEEMTETVEPTEEATDETAETPDGEDKE